MHLQSHVPLLVDLMLKSTVVVMAVLVITGRWRGLSAAGRHVIWLAAFGVLLLLPAAAALALREGEMRPVGASARVVLHMPAAVQQPPAAVSGGPASTFAEPEGGWQLRGWREVVVGVWFSGVLTLLGWRMMAGLRARSLRRCGERVGHPRAADLFRRLVVEGGIDRAVELRMAAECGVAMTWGTWRPVVMLPAGACGWSDDRLEWVLRHELAHVKRRDCLSRLCGQLACAVYWPNPFLWLAARRARLAQEQACDDRVLAAGVPVEGYALELVALTREFGRRLRGAVMMAEPSTLKARVSGMMAAGRNRSGMRTSMVVVVLGVALAVLAGCSAVEVREGKMRPVAIVGGAGETNEVVTVDARFVEIKGALPLEGPLAFLAKRLTDSTDTVVAVLTPEQATLVLAALEGLKGTDMVSSPKVTVASGNPAVMRVGQEIRYPSRWGKAPNGVDWTPSEFVGRTIGVELAVTPGIRQDGSLHLKVAPTSTEFEGFIEFEETKSKGANTKWILVDGSPMEMKSVEGIPIAAAVPVFSVRTMTADVNLLSGQTVVLRGGERKRFYGENLAQEPFEAGTAPRTSLVLVSGKNLGIQR